MSKIRNMAVLAAKATGKTSLVEAILFNAKVTKRLGKVDSGNTVSDFDAEEIERNMSLLPSICSFEAKGHRIHIIDTAGYSDFMNESKMMARVADNALIVVNGVDGVKSQDAKYCQVLDEDGTPRFVFINQMDKELANMDRAYESLSALGSYTFAPITVAARKDGKLAGVIDLVSMKFLEYKDDGSGSFEEKDVPDDFSDLAESYREKLMDAVAETDDSLMERYLEGEEIKPEEISKGLKNGVVAGSIVPVLSGSATLNIGAQPVLDYFLEYSAAPEERPDVPGKDRDGNPASRKRSTSEPVVATVIKTVVDQYAGKTSICKVLSGVLKADMNLEIGEKNRKTKATGLGLVCGKEQKSISQAEPGDIACILKSDELNTGETISDVSAVFTMDRVPIPDPVIALAITPTERGEEDKLSRGLGNILDEDPLLQTKRDEQTKQLTICGTGQVHLDSVVKRLKKRFSIDVQVSPPEIPYRETITKSVKYVEYTHKKQTGGAGQYARVFIDMEPMERGGGYEFVDKIFGGVIDQGFRPSVDKGIQAKMTEGILAGCPVTDIRVSLVDGKTHPVDSKDIAFQVAGREVFKKAFDQCGPVLLEPVMAVEIEVPDECMGDVIGDINSRRGRVSSTEQGNNVTIIKCTVPLAEMLRYGPDLDSMTSGQGTYSMELDHYEEVPKRVADEVIAKYHKKKEEEKE